MRNYLNKLIEILQFKKTDSPNRFKEKQQVENPYNIFLSDSILLVYYRYKE